MALRTGTAEQTIPLTQGDVLGLAQEAVGGVENPGPTEGAVVTTGEAEQVIPVFQGETPGLRQDAIGGVEGPGVGPGQIEITGNAIQAIPVSVGEVQGLEQEAVGGVERGTEITGSAVQTIPVTAGEVEGLEQEAIGNAGSPITGTAEQTIPVVGEGVETGFSQTGAGELEHTGTAAQSIPAPIQEGGATGTVPGFTILGQLEAPGGERFQGNPLGGHGDFGIQLRNNVLDLYFNSGFQICHSTLAFDGDNVRTGWSLTPLQSPNVCAPQLAKTPGTRHSEGLDTPWPYWHPVLNKQFLYFQAAPGAVAAEENGLVGEVQAGSSTDPDNINRVWVHEPGTVISPLVNGLPGEQGFSIAEGEPPNQVFTWRGGCSEMSALWDPDLGRTVMFYRGLTWPGFGPYEWRMFRAVEHDVIDGLTFDKDTEPAFYPYAEILAIGETHSAYGSRGAHHFNVTRDPYDGTYHLVYLHGVGTGNWGIYHAYSRAEDKGVAGSWVPTLTPIMTMAEVSQFAQASGWGPMTDIGGPYLLWDPDLSQVWLFWDAAPTSRYDNGRPMVAVGARSFIGVNRADQDIPVATQVATGELEHTGTATQSFAITQTVAGELEHTGEADQAFLLYQAATGELVRIGGAVQTIPAPDQAATGDVRLAITGTATQDFAPAQTATGDLEHVGPAVQAIPEPDQAATGDVRLAITGTATQSFAPTQTVSGEIDHTGTADQDIPVPGQAAIGERGDNIFGTAAQSFLPSQAALGELEHDGPAVQTIPAPDQVATGELEHTGTADQTVLLSQTVIGELEHSGTATQAVPAPDQDADGVARKVGTAAQSFDISQTVIGELEHTGGAVQTFLLYQDAAGKLDRSGDADQTIPAADQVATGDRGVIANLVAQTIPEIAQAAAGDREHSATATQGIPEPVQVAAGDRGVIGDADQSFAVTQTASGLGAHIAGTAGQTFPPVSQAVTGFVGALLTVQFPLKSALTSVGQLTNKGKFFAALGSEREPHFRRSDDGTKYEMTFVSSVPTTYSNPEVPSTDHIGYVEMPVSGNRLTDWGDSDTTYVSTVENSRYRNGISSPTVFQHTELPHKIMLTQAFPGTRPTTAGIEGYISSIEIATTHQPLGEYCRWGFGTTRRYPFMSEDPSLAMMASYTFDNGGTTTYRGGVLKPSMAQRFTDNALLIFGTALSNGGSGSEERPQVFRAVAPVTNETIGAPVYDALPVWSPDDFGYELTEGDMVSVVNDPDRNTLHMLIRVGLNIAHFQSLDWGASWTANPDNDFLIPTEWGHAARDSFGDPEIHIENGFFWITCYVRPSDLIGNNSGSTNAGIYQFRVQRVIA